MSPKRLKMALLCVTLVGSSLILTACGDNESSEGDSNSDGSSDQRSASGANDSGKDLAQYGTTLASIHDEMFQIIVMVQQNQVASAATATAEQTEQFETVSSHSRIGQLKDELMEYHIWIDALDEGQRAELAAKARAIDTWSQEVEACYGFITGAGLATFKSRVASVKELNGTLLDALAAQ